MSGTVGSERPAGTREGLELGPLMVTIPVRNSRQITQKAPEKWISGWPDVDAAALRELETVVGQDPEIME